MPQTTLGSLQRSQLDASWILAGFKGPTSKGKEREREGKKVLSGLVPARIYEQAVARLWLITY